MWYITPSHAKPFKDAAHYKAPLINRVILANGQSGFTEGVGGLSSGPAA